MKITTLIENTKGREDCGCEHGLSFYIETARILAQTKTLCFTGHCTAMHPYEIMREIMGEQLQYLHCGDIIQV